MEKRKYFQLTVLKQLDVHMQNNKPQHVRTLYHTQKLTQDGSGTNL